MQQKAMEIVMYINLWTWLIWPFFFVYCLAQFTASLVKNEEKPKTREMVLASVSLLFMMSPMFALVLY